MGPGSGCPSGTARAPAQREPLVHGARGSALVGEETVEQEEGAAAEHRPLYVMDLAALPAHGAVERRGVEEGDRGVRLPWEGRDRRHVDAQHVPVGATAL